MAQYRLDLEKASPAEAVAKTHAPVLLIRGTEDFNIPVRHCRAILKNQQGVMAFWEVPGAGHTGAYGRAPREFERRATDWFAQFPDRPATTEN